MYIIIEHREIDNLDTPKLSIIIISYNTKELTLNCLKSVLEETDRTNLPYEIVLVDNNSTDGSVEAVKALKSPLISIIEEKNNLGFGKGNNLAVKKAKGEYILLLNSDTVVLEGGIEKLFNFYEQRQQKIQFLGGKLLNKDMTLQPSAAPFYSPIVVFLALFLRGDYWGATRYSPSSEKRVDWISGACILTKKSYYTELGGFDEDIFMYMEEVDLLYRAAKRGYFTYFYPEAKFIHLGSASSGQRTFPIVQVYQGFLFFYHKHYSRFSLNLLKIMLKLKAVIGVSIGRVFRNKYLVETYEKAYKIVEMDR